MLVVTNLTFNRALIGKQFDLYDTASLNDGGVLKAIIQKQVKDARMEENVDFLRAVFNLDKDIKEGKYGIENEKLLQDKLEEIYNTFIAQDVDKQVNIDAAMFNNLQQAKARGLKIEDFQHAVTEIERLIRSNFNMILPSNEAYKKYVLTEKLNDFIKRIKENLKTENAENEQVKSFNAFLQLAVKTGRDFSSFDQIESAESDINDIRDLMINLYRAIKDESIKKELADSIFENFRIDEKTLKTMKVGFNIASSSRRSMTSLDAQGLRPKTTGSDTEQPSHGKIERKKLDETAKAIHPKFDTVKSSKPNPIHPKPSSPKNDRTKPRNSP